MKLTSIGIVFHLNKNIFSRILSVNMLKINWFFCDSKQEAFKISTKKMTSQGKIVRTKFVSQSQSVTLETHLKLKDCGLYFEVFLLL